MFSLQMSAQVRCRARPHQLRSNPEHHFVQPCAQSSMYTSLPSHAPKMLCPRLNGAKQGRWSGHMSTCCWDLQSDDAF